MQAKEITAAPHKDRPSTPALHIFLRQPVLNSDCWDTLIIPSERAFFIQNQLRVVVPDLQQRTKLPLDSGFITEQIADLDIQLVTLFLTYKVDLLCHLRTRLKTKLHRSVYVELAYYKDGKGVVQQCYYYDREYRRQGIKITPPMLISCFFPYTKQGILNLLNHEICCDFTHIIVTDGIDVDANTTPLCGAV